VICPWEILAKAIGYLNFMAGYTVFLGPIAGIMIADVRIYHFVPDLRSSCSSTGSSTAERSTFHHSIGRQAVTGTLVAWYVLLFGSLLFPDPVALLACIELARSCSPPCIRTPQSSGSNQFYQSKHSCSRRYLPVPHFMDSGLCTCLQRLYCHILRLACRRNHDRRNYLGR
jgi:hypothetical protein